MPADCLFCRIAARDAPAHVVVDTVGIVGFLDNRPLFKGHTLICPREHVATFTDLRADQMLPMFAVVQRVAEAMTTVLGAEGSFVAMNNVVSQSVPHVHVHVVPRTKGDGLRGFFWPRTTYADAAEAQDYADRLRAAVNRTKNENETKE